MILTLKRAEPFHPGPVAERKSTGNTGKQGYKYWYCLQSKGKVTRHCLPPRLSCSQGAVTIRLSNRLDAMVTVVNAVNFLNS